MDNWSKKTVTSMQKISLIAKSENCYPSKFYPWKSVTVGGCNVLFVRTFVGVSLHKYDVKFFMRQNLMDAVSWEPYLNSNHQSHFKKILLFIKIK